jgi:hypothetical protein
VTVLASVGLSGVFGGTCTLGRIVGSSARRARAAGLRSKRMSAEIGLVTRLIDNG